VPSTTLPARVHAGRGFRRNPGSLVALAVCTLHGQAVAAPPAVPEKSVLIGRPSAPATLSLRERDGKVWLHADRTRRELPIGTPTDWGTESVLLAGGSRIAVVRASDSAGTKAAALVLRRPGGASEIPWVGRLSPRGDPGERQADVLQLDDRDGDGTPDVVVGRTDERSRICGSQPTVLEARRLDSATLQLRHQAPPALDRSPSRELAVTDRAPAAGVGSGPVLRVLRATSDSTQSGELSESDRAITLTDGDLQTYWSDDGVGAGQATFVTFTVESEGRAIWALAIVPSPLEVPKARGLATPRALRLVTDQTADVRVLLPARPEPGRRYFIVPDPPLAARCLTLLVEADPNTPASPGPVMLAEVEAYIDADFTGLAQLVQELDGDGDDADANVILLSNTPAAADDILRAWPKLAAQGRRRAVRVLTSLSAREPAAREALRLALTEPDETTRNAAFDALLQAGPPGRAMLIPQIASAGERGDQAALALGRAAPTEAIRPLLSALLQPGGSDRPQLRTAIGDAVVAGGAHILAAISGFAQVNPDAVAMRAALALALSRVPSAQPLAAELLRTEAQKAEAFPDRWRLLQAARILPDDPGPDPWLAEIAGSDERWMLRAAAIEALDARGAARAHPIASHGLGDTNPRVRIAAVAALRNEPHATSVLSTHAARDRWPMVRIAALDALAERPAAAGVVKAAVADRSHSVRAAAIRALTTSAARDSWPLVNARLRDPNEWPDVQAEAIRFAATLCVRESTETLLGLLQAGIQLGSPPPDLDTALLAFDALRKLGPESAKKALAIANQPAAPAVLKSAARAQPHVPNCAPMATTPGASS
jgi:hypothetical protein